MKITGISLGSPNGANDSMCKEALAGAREAGAEIEFIHLLDWDIKYCTGCVACVKSLMKGKGNKCVLKDDFDDFLNILLDSDGVLFATPIFEKGATGLFHTLTDRFGPRMDRGNNIISTKIAEKIGGIKPDPRIIQDKVVSFIGIGGSDWSTRIQCDQGMLALTPAWQIIDNECFSWSKNIILEPEKVKRVNEIGKNLAEAASNITEARYRGEAGVCPHCHSRNFFLTPGSTHAVCCLCGIEGELENIDGSNRFVFPEDQLEHAHDTLSGKFMHNEDIKNNEETNMAARKTAEYKEKISRYREVIAPTPPPSRR